MSGVFDNQVVTGLGQAAAAALLALLVVLIARREEIRLGGEVTVALVRGFVQVVAVGAVLGLLLRGPGWTSVFVLVGMMIAAAFIARRRVVAIPAAFRVALFAIAFGSGLVIVPMTFLGAIESSVAALIPVGSMIIASAMNTATLSLERFQAEVRSHADLVEAGLSLGAGPEVTVRPYARAAVAAGLIPPINTLRSLGIVWIPGIMAGMVLSGTDPVYAAVYQFVVIAMIFAAAGLTSIAGAILVRGQVFTDAEQLLLRPTAEE